MLRVLRHDRDELDDVSHVWLHDRQVRGGHRAVPLQALEEKTNIVKVVALRYKKWMYPADHDDLSSGRPTWMIPV